MKKDCYFLVVISTVVCTVCSIVRCQDCNKTEELIKCLSPIQAITDERTFGFSMNGEELVRLCPNLHNGLECVDRYTQRCMAEEERNHFHRLYRGTTQVFRKVCDPGPYQEEFLIHLPCMRQVNPDYEDCVHKYLQRIGTVVARMNEPDRRRGNETSSKNDSELRTVCCSFRDYLMCSKRIVQDKCGERTARFTEDFLNQMSLSLIQAHCENYPHGSNQCQASPASQNSPRVLPLTLFLVIPMYVCRST